MLRKMELRKLLLFYTELFLGSLDRFMAYILEETKGNLPLWLAPTQVKVLPVKNEYHLDYANEIYQLLLDEGFEVELDSRDEKLGYRIREAQNAKSKLYPCF